LTRIIPRLYQKLPIHTNVPPHNESQYNHLNHQSSSSQEPSSDVPTYVDYAHPNATIQPLSGKACNETNGIHNHTLYTEYNRCSRNVQRSAMQKNPFLLRLHEVLLGEESHLDLTSQQEVPRYSLEVYVLAFARAESLSRIHKSNPRLQTLAQIYLEYPYIPYAIL
jgi:hypothetical protein